MLEHIIQHPVRFTIAFFKFAAAYHLTTTHLFEIASSGGPSMLPTFLVAGESLAIDKTARHGRRIQVGDLVAYKIPTDPNDIGVKRVIGLPGDYVSIGTPGERGADYMIQVRYPTSPKHHATQ
jgi:inner membrane protease subunit 1